MQDKVDEIDDGIIELKGMLVQACQRPGHPSGFLQMSPAMYTDCFKMESDKLMKLIDQDVTQVKANQAYMKEQKSMLVKRFTDMLLK